MMSKTLKRITAIATLFAFVVSGQGLPAFAGAAVPFTSSQTALPSLPLSGTGARQLAAAPLMVPASIGRMEEFQPAPLASEQPTFLHVQTAHGDAAAQMALVRTLNYLKKNYKMDLLLLEGADEQLDPELDRFFENENWNREVARERVKTGRMSGAAYFLMRQPKNSVKAFGLESSEAYRSNRRDFLFLIQKREILEKFLNSTESELDRLFSKKASKDILDLRRQERAFDEGRLDWMGWLDVLKKQALTDLNLDLEHVSSQTHWPALLRVFWLRALEPASRQNEAALDIKNLPDAIAKIFKSAPTGGNFRYGEVRLILEDWLGRTHTKAKVQSPAKLKTALKRMVLESEIRPEELLRETQALAGMLMRFYAHTSSERKLLRLDADLKLLRGLLLTELSSQEYQRVLEQEKKLVPSRILRRIQKQDLTNSHALIPGNTEQSSFFPDSEFETALRFYRGAKQRETKMAENAVKLAGQSKASWVVMVSGGFHGTGLRDEFVKRNIPYMRLTPQIGMRQEGYSAIISQDPRDVYRQAFLDHSLGEGRAHIEDAAVLPISRNALHRLGVDETGFLSNRTRALSAWASLNSRSHGSEAVRQFNASLFSNQYGLRWKRAGQEPVFVRSEVRARPIDGPTRQSLHPARAEVRVAADTADLHKQIHRELHKVDEVLHGLPQGTIPEFSKIQVLLAALYGGSVQLSAEKPRIASKSKHTRPYWEKRTYDFRWGLYAWANKSNWGQLSPDQREKVRKYIDQAVERLGQLGIRAKERIPSFVTKKQISIGDILTHAPAFQNPFLQTFLGESQKMKSASKAQSRFERAVEVLKAFPDSKKRGLTKSEIAYLRSFDNIFIPAFAMDQDAPFVIRVQHNNVRGPYKGGIRLVDAYTLVNDKHFKELFDDLKTRLNLQELRYFLRKYILEETLPLSFGMTSKAAVANLPYGGGKGTMLAADVFESSDGTKAIADLHGGQDATAYLYQLARGTSRVFAESAVVRSDKDIPAADLNSGRYMDTMADEQIETVLEDMQSKLNGILTRRAKSMPAEDVAFIEHLQAIPQYTMESLEKALYLQALSDYGAQLRAAGRKIPTWAKPFFEAAATYTSKTEKLMGSVFRADSTGYGGIHVLKDVVIREQRSRSQQKPLLGMTAKLMGLGAVGAPAAEKMIEEGMEIKMISLGPLGALYKASGGFTRADIALFRKMLNEKKSLALVGKDGYEAPGVEYIVPAEVDARLLGLDADVFVLAAVENAIRKENVAQARGKIFLELANGAITNDAYDRLVQDHDTMVIPDTMANAGGVTVSYYEWLQNLRNERWTREDVIQRLEKQLSGGVERVAQVRQKYDTDWRTAADILMILEVLEGRRAEKNKSIRSKAKRSEVRTANDQIGGFSYLDTTKNGKVGVFPAAEIAQQVKDYLLANAAGKGIFVAAVLSKGQDRENPDFVTWQSLVNEKGVLDSSRVEAFTREKVQPLTARRSETFEVHQFLYSLKEDEVEMIERAGGKKTGLLLAIFPEKTGGNPEAPGGRGERPWDMPSPYSPRGGQALQADRGEPMESLPLFGERETASPKELVTIKGNDQKRSEVRVAPSQLSPEEITAARTEEFFAIRDELLAIFSRYKKAKGSGKETEQTRLLTQARGYARILPSFISEIRSRDAAEQKILDSYVSMDGKARQGTATQLGQDIRSLTPRFVEQWQIYNRKGVLEADKQAANAALNRLNAEVVRLAKRRLKLQLLQFKNALEADPLHQGTVFALLMSITDLYQRIRYEYQWRTFRSDGAIKTARLPMIGALGLVRDNLPYQSEPLLRVDSQDQGAVTISQIVWKFKAVQGSEPALIPEMTSMRFPDFPTALRGKEHALESQEQDYAALTDHDFILRGVKDTLDWFVKSRETIPDETREQLIATLMAVQEGPNGRFGLARRRARHYTPGARRVQANVLEKPGPKIALAITNIETGTIEKLKEASGAIEAAQLWTRARREYIEKITAPATSRKRDYAYALMRDALIRDALNAIKTDVTAAVVSGSQPSMEKASTAEQNLRGLEQTYFRFIAQGGFGEPEITLYKNLQRELRGIISTLAGLNSDVSRSPISKSAKPTAEALDRKINGVLGMLTAAAERRRRSFSRSEVRMLEREEVAPFNEVLQALEKQDTEQLRAAVEALAGQGVHTFFAGNDETLKEWQGRPFFVSRQKPQAAIDALSQGIAFKSAVSRWRFENAVRSQLLTIPQHSFGAVFSRVVSEGSGETMEVILAATERTSAGYQYLRAHGYMEATGMTGPFIFITIPNRPQEAPAEALVFQEAGLRVTRKLMDTGAIVTEYRATSPEARLNLKNSANTVKQAEEKRRRWFPQILSVTEEPDATVVLTEDAGGEPLSRMIPLAVSTQYSELFSRWRSYDATILSPFEILQRAYAQWIPDFYSQVFSGTVPSDFLETEYFVPMTDALETLHSRPDFLKLQQASFFTAQEKGAEQPFFYLNLASAVEVLKKVVSRHPALYTPPYLSYGHGSLGLEAVQVDPYEFFANGSFETFKTVLPRMLDRGHDPIGDFAALLADFYGREILFSRYSRAYHYSRDSRAETSGEVPVLYEFLDDDDSELENILGLMDETDQAVRELFNNRSSKPFAFEQQHAKPFQHELTWRWRLLMAIATRAVTAVSRFQGTQGQEAGSLTAYVRASQIMLTVLTALEQSGLMAFDPDLEKGWRALLLAYTTHDKAGFSQAAEAIQGFLSRSEVRSADAVEQDALALSQDIAGLQQDLRLAIEAAEKRPDSADALTVSDDPYRVFEGTPIASSNEASPRIHVGQMDDFLERQKAVTFLFETYEQSAGSKNPNVQEFRTSLSLIESQIQKLQALMGRSEVRLSEAPKIINLIEAGADLVPTRLRQLKAETAENIYGAIAQPADLANRKNILLIGGTYEALVQLGVRSPEAALTVVDISMKQLEALRELLNKNLELASRVQLYRADARQLPPQIFKDGSFDFIDAIGLGEDAFNVLEEARQVLPRIVAEEKRLVSFGGFVLNDVLDDTTLSVSGLRDGVLTQVGSMPGLFQKPLRSEVRSAEPQQKVRVTKELAEAFADSVHYAAIAGRPGAGKGTVTERFIAEVNALLPPEKQFEVLVTGDWFRGVTRLLTGQAQDGDDEHYGGVIDELPSDVGEIMASGELVPDEITAKFFNTVLQLPAFRGRRILFDGFPRTQGQLEVVNKGFLFPSMDLFVLVDTAEETAIQRILGGNRGRKDDVPTSVTKRMKQFSQHTAPMMDALRGLPNTITLNGEANRDEVYSDFLEKLIDRLYSGSLPMKQPVRRVVHLTAADAEPALALTRELDGMKNRGVVRVVPSTLEQADWLRDTLFVEHPDTAGFRAAVLEAFQNNNIASIQSDVPGKLLTVTLKNTMTFPGSSILNAFHLYFPQTRLNDASANLKELMAAPGRHSDASHLNALSGYLDRGQLVLIEKTFIIDEAEARALIAGEVNTAPEKIMTESEYESTVKAVSERISKARSVFHQTKTAILAAIRQREDDERRKQRRLERDAQDAAQKQISLGVFADLDKALLALANDAGTAGDAHVLQMAVLTADEYHRWPTSLAVAEMATAQGQVNETFRKKPTEAVEPLHALLLAASLGRIHEEAAGFIDLRDFPAVQLIRRYHQMKNYRTIADSASDSQNLETIPRPEYQPIYVFVPLADRQKPIRPEFIQPDAKPEPLSVSQADGQFQIDFNQSAVDFSYGVAKQVIANAPKVSQMDTGAKLVTYLSADNGLYTEINLVTVDAFIRQARPMVQVQGWRYRLNPDYVEVLDGKGAHFATSYDSELLNFFRIYLHTVISMLAAYPNMKTEQLEKSGLRRVRISKDKITVDLGTGEAEIVQVPGTGTAVGTFSLHALFKKIGERFFKHADQPVVDLQSGVFARFAYQLGLQYLRGEDGPVLTMPETRSIVQGGFAELTRAAAQKRSEVRAGADELLNRIDILPEELSRAIRQWAQRLYLKDKANPKAFSDRGLQGLQGIEAAKYQVDRVAHLIKEALKNSKVHYADVAETIVPILVQVQDIPGVKGATRTNLQVISEYPITLIWLLHSIYSPKTEFVLKAALRQDNERQKHRQRQLAQVDDEGIFGTRDTRRVLRDTDAEISVKRSWSWAGAKRSFSKKIAAMGQGFWRGLVGLGTWLGQFRNAPFQAVAAVFSFGWSVLTSGWFWKTVVWTGLPLGFGYGVYRSYFVFIDYVTAGHPEEVSELMMAVNNGLFVLALAIPTVLFTAILWNLRTHSWFPGGARKELGAPPVERLSKTELRERGHTGPESDQSARSEVRAVLAPWVEDSNQNKTIQKARQSKDLMDFIQSEPALDLLVMHLFQARQVDRAEKPQAAQNRETPMVEAVRRVYEYWKSGKAFASADELNAFLEPLEVLEQETRRDRENIQGSLAKGLRAKLLLMAGFPEEALKEIESGWPHIDQENFAFALASGHVASVQGPYLALQVIKVFSLINGDIRLLKEHGNSDLNARMDVVLGVYSAWKQLLSELDEYRAKYGAAKDQKTSRRYLRAFRNLDEREKSLETMYAAELGLTEAPANMSARQEINWAVSRYRLAFAPIQNAYVGWGVDYLWNQIPRMLNQDLKAGVKRRTLVRVIAMTEHYENFIESQSRRTMGNVDYMHQAVERLREARTHLNSALRKLRKKEDRLGNSPVERRLNALVTLMDREIKRGYKNEHHSAHGYYSDLVPAIADYEEMLDQIKRKNLRGADLDRLLKISRGLLEFLKGDTQSVFESGDRMTSLSKSGYQSIALYKEIARFENYLLKQTRVFQPQSKSARSEVRSPQQIIWDHETIPEQSLVGEKPYKLMKLHQLGFRVPRFFVVKGNGTGSLDLNENLRDAFDVLNKPVIARSAHPDEGGQHSFSGIFMSFPDIREFAAQKPDFTNLSEQDRRYAEYEWEIEVHDLQRAYQSMVEMAGGYSAQQYLEQNQITDFDPNRMNMVVMEQIPIDVFGMFLTADQGHPDQVLIQYEVRNKTKFGYSEKLSAGGIAVYNRRTQTLETHEQSPEVATILKSMGAEAAKIHDQFGLQQVEMASTGAENSVFVLQSRGINLADAKDVPRYANYSDFDLPTKDAHAVGYGYYTLPILVVDDMQQTRFSYEKTPEYSRLKDAYMRNSEDDIAALEALIERQRSLYRAELEKIAGQFSDGYVLVIRDPADVISRPRSAGRILNLEGQNYEALNSLIRKAKVVIRGRTQNAIRHEDWNHIEMAGITVIPPESDSLMGRFAFEESKDRDWGGHIINGDKITVLVNTDGIFMKRPSARSEVRLAATNSTRIRIEAAEFLDGLFLSDDLAEWTVRQTMPAAAAKYLEAPRIRSDLDTTLEQAEKLIADSQRNSGEWMDRFPGETLRDQENKTYLIGPELVRRYGPVLLAVEQAAPAAARFIVLAKNESEGLDLEKLINPINNRLPKNRRLMIKTPLQVKGLLKADTLRGLGLGEVDAALLRKLIPDFLPLNVFELDAWVSQVPGLTSIVQQFQALSALAAAA